MKKALFILLTFMQTLLVAQNYNVFPIGSSQMFFAEDSIVFFMTVDSSYILGGNKYYEMESELEEYLVPSQICSGNPYGSTFIGKQIIEKDSSVTFVYSNGNINLKRRGSASSVFSGDSVWINYSGIKLDTLYNGQIDSVETYLVVCVNPQLLYCANNMKIEISKGNGIVTFPGVFKRLSTWVSGSIKEIERISFSPLTYQEVFDFEVGDEFHFNSYVDDKNFSYYSGSLINLLVLSKNTTSSTVKYKFLKRKDKSDYDRVSGQSTTVITTNTFYRSYPLNNVPIFENGSYSLDSSIFSWGLVAYPEHSLSVNFNNRSSVKFTEGFEALYSDSCYSGKMDASRKVKKYSEGLGNTFYSYFGSDSGIQFDEKRWLGYFKKGNITWGTPQYIGIGENSISKIRIFPNPVKDILNIDLPSSVNTAEITFYNINGQLVFVSEVLNGQIQIPEIPSGVYFAEIELDGKIVRKKIIVQK